MPARIGYPGRQRWVALYRHGPAAVFDDGRMRGPCPLPVWREMAALTSARSGEWVMLDRDELLAAAVPPDTGRKLLARQQPAARPDPHQLLLECAHLACG